MSLRIRTPHIEAYKPLNPAPDPANFIIPDVNTRAGFLQKDIFAAWMTRVKVWDIAIAGVVENSSSDFSASSTFSGSDTVPITPNTPPSVADESVFVYNMEGYPIFDTASGIGTFGGSTALTMLGAGIVLEPNAPPTLDITTENRTGPISTPLTTQIILGVERGTAFLDLSYNIVFEAPGLPPDEAVMYRVFMKLQTNPNGHPLSAGGTSVPVQVGTLTILIPNWLEGGSNSVSLPLYADTDNDEDVWLSGNFDYTGNGITGTLDMLMTPVECWPYEDSDGNPAWDNDCNLLVPYDQLEHGEPSAP